MATGALMHTARCAGNTKSSNLSQVINVVKIVPGNAAETSCSPRLTGYPRALRWSRHLEPGTGHQPRFTIVTVHAQPKLRRLKMPARKGLRAIGAFRLSGREVRRPRNKPSLSNEMNAIGPSQRQLFIETKKPAVPSEAPPLKPAPWRASPTN
ncbi:hypothetical protein GOBAR_AA33510 [Gossypium barbadense]|uniref:Uncharacterized protein n=1 Tax=Gossypium barbadense TaxID=3634 RepID=A0A2P5W7W3_GOSBA|nr:hypothetical protein GOBAR_AA33510 [Gossypium barbadense]